MGAFDLRVPVQVFVASLPSQLPVNMPGKAAKDGPSALASATWTELAGVPGS